MSRVRFVAMAPVLLCSALATRAAHAQLLGTLNPGGAFGYGKAHGGDTYLAGGVEVSYMRLIRAWSKEVPGWGAGPFGQAMIGWFQAKGPDGRARSYDPHPIVTLGAQLGSAFGFELGMTYRGSTSQYAPTLSTHLGPYFSMGIATIAGRFEILPIRVGSGATQGAEWGITATAKLPLLLWADHTDVVIPTVHERRGAQ